jgi:tetratricopeptide (TPR) repeat protein
MADADRAVALEPRNARSLLQRAAVLFAVKKAPQARADLDAALAVEPKLVDARLFRAGLLLDQKDPAGAISDLEAASAVLSKYDVRHLRIASLYERAGRVDMALQRADAFFDLHPNEQSLVRVQNLRCWFRGLLNIELDKALAACDEAVAKSSKAAFTLDSRGLVHLRRGDLDAAIADYSGSVAANPSSAWSLYGRSLAERRKGDAAAADADRAAALKLKPDLVEEGERLGLEP